MKEKKAKNSILKFQLEVKVSLHLMHHSLEWQWRSRKFCERCQWYKANNTNKTCTYDCKHRKEHAVCFMTLLHVTSNSHTETKCNPNQLYLGTHTINVHPTKVENNFLTSQQKWQNNKPENFSIIWWYTSICELVQDIHVTLLRK